jgi:hypothetical protein
MGRAEDIFQRLRNEGESGIDLFIATRQSEELFLDFKRSADGGTGTRLHDNDRSNLGKAISGFGNSEGGVIVWGVGCSRDPNIGDVACSKEPIENPNRFVSWLEGTVSGCTVPPHRGVRQMAVESQADPGTGYVATLIPKSYEGPHQCVRRRHYYIRAGSDFVPAPHGVLAAMFGKRVHPFVFHMWASEPARIVPRNDSRAAIEFGLGLLISSKGPGLARDVYVNLKLLPPGPPCEAAVTFPDSSNWRGYQSFGVIYNVSSIPEFRLSPEMTAHPLGMRFHLEEPIIGSLSYRLVFGASELAPRKLESETSQEEIRRAMNDFLADPNAPDANHVVVRRIMQVEESGPELADFESYYDTV